MTHFILFLFALATFIAIRFAIKKPVWVDRFFYGGFFLYAALAAIGIVHSRILGEDPEEYFKIHNLILLRSIIQKVLLFAMWVKLLRYQIWKWFGKTPDSSTV